MSRFIVAILMIVLLSCCAAAPAGAAVGEKTTYKIGLVIGAPKDKATEIDVLNLATAAFFQSRRFKVIERSQLNSLFTEKDLQGFLGKGNKKLSDVLGLDLLGILSYTVENRRFGVNARPVFTLDVRLADVKTGTILGAITSERDSLVPPKTVREASQQLFLNIREAFPPLGYVIKTAGKDVIVDLGTRAGLKPQDSLEIVREGQEIIHPVTGEVLPAELVVVGKLKVSSTSPRFSTCKLSKGSAPVGSRVRLAGQKGRWRSKLGKTLDILQKINIEIR